MKMKFTVGKQYKITSERFCRGIVTTIALYTGKFKGYPCDNCPKQNVEVHEFLVGITDVNSTHFTDIYHYGSECIKKIKIEEAI